MKLQLPDKAKAFWPLVRILETFPDNNQVLLTARILKSNLSAVIVNVTYLTSLELYFELEYPQVYTDESNNSAHEGGDLEENENVSEVDVPVSESTAVRSSRRTAHASRAQTSVLASRGLFIYLCNYNVKLILFSCIDLGDYSFKLIILGTSVARAIKNDGKIYISICRLIIIIIILLLSLSLWLKSSYRGGCILL